MYGVEGMKQTFQTYAGSTMFLAVFLVCLIYCFCKGKEIARKRLLFICILSVLFVFNDLSMKLVGKVTEIATYYRFLWAIPILPLIGWAGTKVIMEREKRWEKGFVFVLMFCVFWGWSSSFVTETSIRVPQNLYNLSGDVIQVCNIIEQDKKEENPVVIFDLECQMAARLYDPTLVWGISRNAYQLHNDMEGYENAGRYKAEKALIHAVNHGIKEEPKRLSQALKKKDVDYIVTWKAFEMDAYLDGLGYRLVDMTDSRCVYARKSES